MLKLLSIVAILLSLPVHADDTGDPIIKTAWGHISKNKEGELAFLMIEERPENGRLELSGMANIIAAIVPNLTQTPVDLEFSQDATKVFVQAPEGGVIVVETPSKSQQYGDGRIVFLATQATIHGNTAKLEQTNGHDRIGFWTNADDYVTWDYNASRPGNYELHLTYATSAGDEKTASEITVAIDDQPLTATLDNTGSWYRYRTQNLGVIRIPSAGKHTLTVKATKQVGPAVMNLKAITLRPATEGSPIKQAEDGTVTMHAHDVIIYGVKLQWESKPQKQTVGFWVNESDIPEWRFEATKTGTFDVEILQGCGKGQGGSTVAIVVGKADEPATLKRIEFTVEDTGHFQNFKLRKIGTIEIEKPGQQLLRVIPMKKAKGAVMDLRQVRLIPTK